MKKMIEEERQQNEANIMFRELSSDQVPGEYSDSIVIRRMANSRPSASTKNFSEKQIVEAWHDYY